MDKTQLKKILKPLMKECIKEILAEQGLIKVLSESLDEQSVKKAIPNKQIVKENVEKPADNNLEEYKKQMIQSIGKSGYLSNNFNPFSNTEILKESQATDIQPSMGMKSNIDNSVLNDPGVDISGIMAMSKTAWKAHMGGKGK